MTEHNKLVRDNIPEYLDAKGIAHTEYIAGSEEYRTKLFEKLVEEAKELAESEDLSELADLVEVIEAVKKLKQWTTEEVEDVRRIKKKNEGDLKNALFWKDRNPRHIGGDFC